MMPAGCRDNHVSNFLLFSRARTPSAAACSHPQGAGLTQVEVAQRIGIIQALISDYERDKLRLNAEMLVRFAQALNVSADELLGLSADKRLASKNPSLKILRRLNKIASLPPTKQKAFLQTIHAL